MLHIDENYVKSKAETKRLTEVNQKLELVVMTCKSKTEEDTKKIFDQEQMIEKLNSTIVDNRNEIQKHKIQINR